MIYIKRTLNLSYNFIHLIAGIIIGFVLASQLRILKYHWKTTTLCPFKENFDDNIDQQRNVQFDKIVNQLKEQKVTSNLLLIGVMTAQKYLDTRALSIYETWAKQIPGKIIFFSSLSSK